MCRGGMLRVKMAHKILNVCSKNVLVFFSLIDWEGFENKSGKNKVVYHFSSWKKIGNNMEPKLVMQ